MHHLVAYQEYQLLINSFHKEKIFYWSFYFGHSRLSALGHSHLSHYSIHSSMIHNTFDIDFPLQTFKEPRHHIAVMYLIKSLNSEGPVEIHGLRSLCLYTVQWAMSIYTHLHTHNSGRCLVTPICTHTTHKKIILSLQ